MALMYIFTHITKLILYSKQSFGELTPERLDECKNNSSDNFSNSLLNNKDKGKVELEYVETSLNEILQKIKNCSNTDDLYDIQRKTKDLNDKVSSYLFFNY